MKSKRSRLDHQDTVVKKMSTPELLLTAEVVAGTLLMAVGI
jgi:hypothetical protein